MNDLEDILILEERLKMKGLTPDVAEKILALKFIQNGGIAEPKAHAELFEKELQKAGYKVELDYYKPYNEEGYWYFKEVATENKSDIEVELEDTGALMSGGGNLHDRGERPSPAESATLYPEGHEQIGQDGNVYRISVASNGTHRWVKVKDGMAIEYEETKEEDEKPKPILKLSDIPDIVRQFMPVHQQKIIVELGGHEDIVEDLVKIINQIPLPYETEKINKEDKIAYLHYFHGNTHSYIIEKDSFTTKQYQAFGWTVLNGDTINAEFGYIDIEDDYVQSGNAELDFYFDPIPMSEVFKKFAASDENTYADKIEERKTEAIIANLTAEEQIIKGSYDNDYVLNRAIEKLIDIKSENGSEYSAEEISFVSQYSGMGGLQNEGAEGKGILYEYYTPDIIIQKMWGLAYKYGFKAGMSVLEPSCSVGKFFKYLPDVEGDYAGIEPNHYSATIARLLYRTISITEGVFEQEFIKNNKSIGGKIADLQKYDLVIGNPPYGEFSGKWAGMGEKTYSKAGNYIEYFILRGLDITNPGGLLIYIVGAETKAGGKLFLQGSDKTCKKMIAERADLIDAYRLPAGLFDRTNVVTEIVVFKKK